MLAKKNKYHNLLRTATRLSVRAKPSWLGYVWRVLVCVFVIATCSWLAYLAGRLPQRGFQGIPVEELLQLRNETRRLRQDNLLLIKQSVRLHQNRAIDHNAQNHLVQKMGQLQKENEALRTHLALLEEVLRRPDSNQPIRILNLSVQHNPVGAWHFQALLATGNPSQTFKGHYRIIREKDGLIAPLNPEGQGDLQIRSAALIEDQLPAVWQKGTTIVLQILSSPHKQVLTSRRFMLK